MDAALLLRDARRDSGCPALLFPGAAGAPGPETGGPLLSVPLHPALADPLRTGEDLLPEEVLPWSACGVSPRLLPVRLHRAPDPDRQHRHFDRAGEAGVGHAAGRALRPGSLLHPGVPQRALQAAVQP